jgi:hypothetical protein
VVFSIQDKGSFLKTAKGEGRFTIIKE